jgi:hypothetical protein
LCARRDCFLCLAKARAKNGEVNLISVGDAVRELNPVTPSYARAPAIELRNVSLELRNVSLELRNVSLELRNVSLELRNVSTSACVIASCQPL